MAASGRTEPSGELNKQRWERPLLSVVPIKSDTVCQPKCYTRKFHTKAGEVDPKVPKLRKQTFETAIIERYRGHRRYKLRFRSTSEYGRYVQPLRGAPRRARGIYDIGPPLRSRTLS